MVSHAACMIWHSILCNHTGKCKHAGHYICLELYIRCVLWMCWHAQTLLCLRASNTAEHGLLWSCCSILCIARVWSVKRCSNLHYRTGGLASESQVRSIAPKRFVPLLYNRTIWPFKGHPCLTKGATVNNRHYQKCSSCINKPCRHPKCHIHLFWATAFCIATFMVCMMIGTSIKASAFFCKRSRELLGAGPCLSIPDAGPSKNLTNRTSP